MPDRRGPLRATPCHSVPLRATPAPPPPRHDVRRPASSLSFRIRVDACPSSSTPFPSTNETNVFRVSNTPLQRRHTQGARCVPRRRERTLATLQAGGPRQLAEFEPPAVQRRCCPGLGCPLPPPARLDDSSRPAPTACPMSCGPGTRPQHQAPAPGPSSRLQQRGLFGSTLRASWWTALSEFLNRCLHPIERGRS